MDPTPYATPEPIIRLGNLHPGVDGTMFLVVFVLVFIVFGTVAYVAAVSRRSRAP